MSPVPVSSLEVPAVRSVAIGCLFRVAIDLSRSGRKLVLVGDRGQVARPLNLTGLPPGVERLSDGPNLRLVSGPWARAGRTTSSQGAIGAV